MRKCELCVSTASLYCESDQASLCWRCDSKVHTANFLVAKHTRTLLCHVCQALTPWTASGEKIGPTVFVCQRCSDRPNNDDQRHQVINFEEGEENYEDGDDDVDDDDRSSDEDDLDGEAEEEEDDQVVPWSSSSNPPPPVSTFSSSSSDESSSSSSRRCIKNDVKKKIGETPDFSWKRRRENADLCFDDQDDQYHCCSSNQNTAAAQLTTYDEEATTLNPFKPSSNDQNRDLTVRSSEDKSDLRSTAMTIGSKKRFQKEMLVSILKRR